MSDSTINLEQIEAAQASKEVTANALFDAASPAMIYGRHMEECAGLTWGYYGGRYGGAPIANGALLLEASSVNYVVVDRATGVVSLASGSDDEWNDSVNFARAYKITTGASAVTSWEDHRAGGNGTQAGGGGGGSGTSPTTTLGDLIVRGASTDDRLPVGADGQVLMVDSAEPLGVKWDTASAVTFLYASQAWVEVSGNDSTGETGNPNKPFATINAALDATTGPTVIHIGMGTFASVTHDYDYGAAMLNAASKLRPHLWFKGAKMPALDSDTAPTLLQDGSVISGAMIIHATTNRRGLLFTDIGFDAGIAKATAGGWSGTPRDAFGYFNIGQIAALAPARGGRMHNVIGLCTTAAAPVHAMSFENTIGLRASNVRPIFGCHGLVFKSIDCIVDGVYSAGHSLECVVAKDDSYARCYDVTVTNIVCGEIGVGDTPNALRFTTGSATNLERVSYTGVKMRGISTNDIVTDTIGSGVTKNVRVDGLHTANGVVRGSFTNCEKSSFFVNGNAIDGEVLLTDAATVATDASKGNNFRVTLGGNRTLGNPTNLMGGQVYNWRISQDATGTRTLAYGSKFKFPGGTAPVLSTAASSKDFMSCQYSATDDTLQCSLMKGLA